jgi:hypothetical protein
MRLLCRHKGQQPMIEVMRHVDEHFYLDVKLASLFLPQRKKLSVLSRKVPRIRIIAPIAVQDLVLAGNDYDRGLYLLRSISLNNLHVTPMRFMNSSRLVVRSQLGHFRRFPELYESSDVES